MASFADASWVRPYLPFSDEEKATAIIVFEDLAGNGGLSGEMKVIKVTWSTDKPTCTFIQKTIATEQLQRSQVFGNAREAFFYNILAPTISKAGILPLPIVLYAQGDMTNGFKIVIMEDLRHHAVPSGVVFGPACPMNWGRNLAADIARFHFPHTAEEVALKTFCNVAKMHRFFWQDGRLFEHSWLRGADWLKGDRQEDWEIEQSKFVIHWQHTKAKISNGTSAVQWNANLLACVDAALKYCGTWEAYQQQLNRRWTLVHGDFHPANIMWMLDGDYPMMLDWEMVGLGSGPQDLAMYLILHMVPAQRRAAEDSLLRAYYDVLTDPSLPGNADLTAAFYPFSQYQADFAGGTQRWIWLLGYLAFICPDPMVQYFANQVAAFLEDHGVTPESFHRVKTAV